MRGSRWLPVCALMLWGGAGAWDEDRNGFVQRGAPSGASSIKLDVPITVNILLAGFSHDGELNINIDPLQLEEVLGTMFSVHKPHCEKTKEMMSVQYSITYIVKALNTNDLEQVHAGMQNGLHATNGGAVVPGMVQKANLYDIRGETMERTLDPLVHKYFHLESGRFDDHGDTFHGDAAEAYTIFILNPTKSKLLKDDMGNPRSDFMYRWVYGSGSTAGVPAQTFVSQQGYMVIDLSSGPVSYGSTQLSEGTVSAASLPSVHTYYGEGSQARAESSSTGDASGVPGDDEMGGGYAKEESHEVEFRSSIASAVVACVRHMFLPDTRFDVVDLSDKVFIPLIVLRNHHLFDPTKPDHAHSIDLEAVEKEARRMLLPGQELSFVPVMHDLHNHPQLSMAVRKAIRTDTVHELHNGRYQLVTRSYLDSKLLEAELLEATDLLTSGLMSLAAPSGADFSGQQWEVDDGDVPDLQSAHESRVLPIYVFSLLGLEKGLLMDNQALVASTEKCVLALQSLDPHVTLPYFVEKSGNPGAHEVLHLDARNPTRGVIAGLASAFGSLIPPHTRFSEQHNRSVIDYRWATGHHPFGPFGGANTLSQTFVTTAVRNAVMSRIHLAVSTLSDVVALVEEFSEDFMLDPAGDDIHHVPPDSWIIDRLFHSAQARKSIVALPLNTVSSLHNQMEEMEDGILQSAEMMGALDMREAFDMATTIVLKASRFHRYVKEKLMEAETGLLCCDVIHHSESPTDWGRLSLVALVGLFVFLATQNLGTPQVQQTRSRSRWDKKR